MKQLGLDKDFAVQMSKFRVDKGVYYKNMRLLEQLNLIEKNLVRIQQKAEAEERLAKQQAYTSNRKCSCGKHANLVSEQAKHYLYHKQF